MHFEGDEGRFCDHVEYGTDVVFHKKIVITSYSIHYTKLYDVGLAGGLAAVDLGVIWRIISSWIATVPIAALTSAIIYLGLEVIFL